MSKNGAFFFEISFQTLEGGERLYCKQQRSGINWKRKHFEGEEDTVMKMNVSETYFLTIGVRPGRTIRYMWLDSEKLDLTSVPCPYPCDDNTKYTSQWTPQNFGVKKDPKRRKITVEVEFTSGEFLKSEILGKFYPAKERRHSRPGQHKCPWSGRPFSTVSILCHAPEGTVLNVHRKEFF